ncbi:MAG: hypothetical protein AAFY76_01930 [Cyanobacteria bacterium J06649_11]
MQSPEIRYEVLDSLIIDEEIDSSEISAEHIIGRTANLLSVFGLVILLVFLIYIAIVASYINPTGIS